jgi:hypothetical protein
MSCYKRNRLLHLDIQSLNLDLKIYIIVRWGLLKIKCIARERGERFSTIFYNRLFLRQKKLYLKKPNLKNCKTELKDNIEVGYPLPELIHNLGELKS